MALNTGPSLVQPFFFSFWDVNLNFNVYLLSSIEMCGSLVQFYLHKEAMETFSCESCEPCFVVKNVSLAGGILSAIIGPN